MDASKRGTQKKSDKVKEAVDFIRYGRWPKKMLKLRPEDWKTIIEAYVYRIGDMFKNLTGFLPINALGRTRDRREIGAIVEGSLELSDDLTADTHCFEVSSKETVREMSKNTIHGAGESLLITRKREWVIWSYDYVILSYKGADPRGVDRIVFHRLTFQKTNDILPFLVSLGEFQWRFVIEHFHQLLLNNVKEAKRILEQKEILLNYSAGQIERIKRVNSD